MTQGSERDTATDPDVNQIVAHKIVTAAFSVGLDESGRFLNWLLAGLAGALSLLMSNWEDVAQITTPSRARVALTLLVVAFAIGAAAKAIGVIASSGFRAATAVDWSREENQFLVEHFKPTPVFQHATSLLWQPAKWVANRQIAKLTTHGLIESQRMLTNLAQLSSLLLTVSIFLAVAGLITLV